MHLRNGVPLVISGCTKSMARAYTFEYFAAVLRGQKIKVVHIETGREMQRDAYAFFKGIIARDPDTAKWKIKVRFHLLFQALIFGRHLPY